MIAIIAVILIVDIIGGYILGKKVIVPMVYKNDEMLESFETREEASQRGISSIPGTKHPLDTINLNPAKSVGEILSIEIVLEYDPENISVGEELTARNTEIMDNLSTYLSFKTVDELNNPNNWDRYKRDMFDIVNGILQKGKIQNIYIPSKIIQFN